MEQDLLDEYVPKMPPIDIDLDEIGVPRALPVRNRSGRREMPIEQSGIVIAP